MSLLKFFRATSKGPGLCQSRSNVCFCCSKLRRESGNSLRQVQHLHTRGKSADRQVCPGEWQQPSCSKALDHKVGESTARRLKGEYVRTLAQTKNDPKGPLVKSLSTKAQGRPLLLGQELDKAVQEYIKATRAAGGVVNTAIVMAAAVGIVTSRDVTKLSSNGGYLKRMGWGMWEWSVRILEKCPPHSLHRFKKFS